MKKKYLGLTALTASGLFVSLGYPFFKLIVRAGDNKKGSRKKWFSFRHTRINHPRNGYEDKYEEGKAWCMSFVDTEDGTDKESGANELSYYPSKAAAVEQDGRLTVKMTDMYITSQDGLHLHAYYLPAADSKRIVLLSHGYRGSGFSDFANTAKFLHDNGCDLLFIDQRCCGRSEGKYITFGAKEHLDVLDWTDMLAKNNSAGLPIYLYGESMGAASVLMAAGHTLPDCVRGIISDCGFTSMKQQLRDIADEWFHIQWIELLLMRVSLFCRLFAGFKMSDADTADALSKCTVPVLFFHGSNDTYVKAHNSVINFELCRSKKELVIIPGARHLCCPYVDEALYREKITEFFSGNDQFQVLF